MTNPDPLDVVKQTVAKAQAFQAEADAAGYGRPRPQDISDEEIERRFTYHPPSGPAKGLHVVLRTETRTFARRLRHLLPAGREKSLAFTALEEASFWAHAAIARDPSLHDPDDR